MGEKIFFKFIIDFGCCFETLFLNMIDDLLEDNMNHNHINGCMKAMTMHHGENTSDWKIQILQRNI